MTKSPRHYSPSIVASVTRFQLTGNPFTTCSDLDERDVRQKEINERRGFPNFVR
jgi:hypothetical protein